jgi:type I restriction enzyme S subunit
MMERWELPKGWEWKKLKTLITVNYGKGLSEKLRLSGNVPVYGANGVVGFHNASITKGQTIVIGRKGSAGAVNWSEIACWPIDTTFFIDEFPEILYPKFLYQFLRSQQIDRLQQSAAIPGLNRDVLYSVEVPIPYPDDPARSLAEQRRIVARLETLLGEARALRAEVQFMRRDLAQVMESALAEAFPAPQREVAEGWGWKRLGDFCKTTSGGTPKRNVADYYGGTIPWLKSGELNDGVILQTEETITEKGLNESNAKIFPKGTLLIALYGATVGKLGILGIDSTTNQAICAIFPSDDVEKTFLFWFLRAIRQKLLKSSFGGAQPNISQEIIRNLEVPIPYPNDPARSLDEQRRIVASLERIAEETRALDASLAQDLRDLEALEQSILAAAFRGEV